MARVHDSAVAGPNCHMHDGVLAMHYQSNSFLLTFSAYAKAPASIKLVINFVSKTLTKIGLVTSSNMRPHEELTVLSRPLRRPHIAETEVREFSMLKNRLSLQI